MGVVLAAGAGGVATTGPKQSNNSATTAGTRVTSSPNPRRAVRGSMSASAGPLSTLGGGGSYLGHTVTGTLAVLLGRASPGDAGNDTVRRPLRGDEGTRPDLVPPHLTVDLRVDQQTSPAEPPAQLSA